MIKFRIHPKIWEVEKCKFWKVFKKCQNYGFLTFSWTFYKNEGEVGSRM